MINASQFTFADYVAEIVAAVHALGPGLCPEVQNAIAEAACHTVPVDMVAFTPTRDRTGMRLVLDQAVIRRHVGLCALEMGAARRA